jgi:hypothetical protein
LTFHLVLDSAASAAPHIFVQNVTWQEPSCNHQVLVGTLHQMPTEESNWGGTALFPDDHVGAMTSFHHHQIQRFSIAGHFLACGVQTLSSCEEQWNQGLLFERARQEFSFLGLSHVEDCLDPERLNEAGEREIRASLVLIFFSKKSLSRSKITDLPKNLRKKEDSESSKEVPLVSISHFHERTNFGASRKNGKMQSSKQVLFPIINVKNSQIEHASRA